MSILLVEKDGEAVSAAVMNRGRLYAYQSESDGALRESQVFSGVVDRAMGSIHAVFVRLPGKETGFLQLPADKKLPASGQRLTVQIRRPPFQNKKALLTQDIALAGSFMVYLPESRGIRLSSKITDEADRARLRAAAGQIMPTEGGGILRSAALSVSSSALKEEADTLYARWRSICRKAEGCAAPALLWNGNGFLEKMAQDEASRLEYILTNDPECLSFSPACPVKVCEHPFLLHNVRRRLEKSLRRTVQMKSGAALVIDPCEAMTVIDVNSGMADGGSSAEETAEKINGEAAWEIARLLRLRGIGGMILVDFIDMKSESAKTQLFRTMQETLREDPVQSTVHDITALGLMEITRRRVENAAVPLPDIPCPHCGGTGAALSDQEEDAYDA